MQKNGFTLMELMMMLFIILLLFAMMIPSYKFLFLKSKSNSIHSKLMQAIYLARNTAISTHNEVMICQSHDLKTCEGNWKESYIIFSHEKIFYTFQNISNEGILHWRSFPKNQTFLQFTSDGTLANENGTFWYCLLGEVNPYWAIVLSQEGRARSIYPNASGEVVMEQGEVLKC